MHFRWVHVINKPKSCMPHACQIKMSNLLKTEQQHSWITVTQKNFTFLILAIQIICLWINTRRIFCEMNININIKWSRIRFATDKIMKKNFCLLGKILLVDWRCDNRFSFLGVWFLKEKNRNRFDKQRRKKIRKLCPLNKTDLD